ncbi:phosphoethanolamine transferase domain-containing protein, partial [Pseudomonas syringae pv. tagetis]|uniref:phosphoethanolamine transferase domain-containing protein n=1 Tax=Pseudomonas syringae group genomosp. 7 TaxID=251699 RepID=UPI00376FC59E
KLVVGVVSCVAIGGVAIANYQVLSTMFRNQHELRLMEVPSKYIAASIGYLTEQVMPARRPFVKNGEDANRSPDWAAHARKSVTVLV